MASTRCIALFSSLTLAWLSLPVAAQQGKMEGGMMKVPEGEVMAMSKFGFDETVSALKRAIEDENLMVIHTINMQAMVKMVGLETPGMQSILFFHPRYGKQIYTTARMAGIEPPLKLAVMEREDGKVVVRYRMPSAIFASYPPLADMAEELDGISERVVGKVRMAMKK